MKEYFTTFNNWYNNRVLYHYIGYITSTSNDHNTLKIVSGLYSESKIDKTEFEKLLIKKIKEEVVNVDLDSVEYGENDKVTQKLLLLFNILTLNELVDMSHNRFPFNFYIRKKWSLEHIHAQNSEQIKDPKAIKTWLEETKTAIENIVEINRDEDIEINRDENIDELNGVDISYVKEKIDNYLNDESYSIDEFNTFKDVVIKLFDSRSIHKLDNLALLSSRDNSALNNSIFPVKRNKIIELEREGSFIPLCTKNVFLKLYSNSNNQPYYWSSKDKMAYFTEFKRVINNFKK